MAPFANGKRCWWASLACRGWTWCPETSCSKCHETAPSKWQTWIRGNTKAEHFPNDGFVQVPKSKRDRRKAARAAKAAAAVTHNGGNDPEELEGPSDEDGAAAAGDGVANEEESAAVGLVAATEKVRQLEALSPEVQRLLLDYAKVLDEAKRSRDELQREKRPTKPWTWRLLDAERASDKAKKSQQKLQADIDSLEEEIQKKRSELDEKRTALQAAAISLEEATAALAAVREEGAEDATSNAKNAIEMSSSARSIVEGLAIQIDGLPQAFCHNNHQAALQA